MHATEPTDIDWNPEGKTGPKGLVLAASGDNLPFLPSGRS